MKNKPILRRFTILFFILNTFVCIVNGQKPVNRDTVLLAAHEIINQTTYCGLGTVDSLGQPQIRTMNPFPVGDDFVVWFATSRSSRKVREIKANPDVSVYFADHLSAKGYVNVSGSASVIDDKVLLINMKRDYWNGINDWQEKFVLIKIIPKSIEVINYKFGLNNDPVTFKAPMIRFNK